MKTKFILLSFFIIIFNLFLFSKTSAFENNIKRLPLTGAISQKEIYNKVGILNKDLSKIDIRLPDPKIFDLAGTGETTLSIWLEKLPKIDRNKDKYLILPSQGLIIPINTVAENTKEYKNFVNGKEENFHNYLETGTVEIPGINLNGYGESGNKVIAGHSSFWKKDKGRYKTHFQKIIGLEKGEEIWVFEKNSKTGFFDKYIYKVTNSYDTPEEDVSILKSGKKSELTLFTCTPIGGTAGRWIVKSEFVSKQ